VAIGSTWIICGVRWRSVIAASAVANSSSDSTAGLWSVSPPVRAGHGSRTIRSPGALNELTILVRIAVGHVASGSMGPQAHTVAGIGPVQTVW
jgi:hypothetical protein